MIKVNVLFHIFIIYKRKASNDIHARTKRNMFQRPDSQN